MRERGKHGPLSTDPKGIFRRNIIYFNTINSQFFIEKPREFI